MCGRIVQKTKLGEVVSNLGLDASDLVDRAPKYNIAPGSFILAVSANSKVSYLKWGLIPSWAKDPKIGFKLSNTRSETIQEKPSFRSAFKSRRCVIPVDGFYEWQLQDGKKKPYFIHRNDSDLLLIGGIWESWGSPTGEQVQSCCLLTTAAISPIDSIHDRMPVFIPKNQLNDWLNIETKTESLLAFFQNSEDSQELLLTSVNAKVNNTRFDDESCILPDLKD